MLPEEILKNVYLVAEHALQETRDSWQKNHNASFVRLSKILERQAKELRDLPVSDEFLPKVWRICDQALQKILVLTLEFQALPAGFSVEILAGGWRRHLRGFIAGLPPSSEIPLPEDYWNRRPQDSLRIRWWKWRNRVRRRFIRMRFAANNRLRRLVGKPVLSLPHEQRTFPLHQFVAYHVELPVTRFLFDEWQRFLRPAAEQLEQAHRRCEEMKNDFLLLDHLAMPPSDSSTAPLTGPQQKLHDFLQKLDSFSNELRQNDNEARARLQTAWESLAQPFLHNWNYAGTAMLAEAQYNEQRAAKQWHDFERKSTVALAPWRRHFEAEIGEWQQDLELSRLQLQTLENCFQAFTAIDRRNAERILPILQDTIATLSSSTDRLSAVAIENNAALEKAISSEEKSLLRLLRQEKVPALIDAVTHWQIDHTFESYLAQVKSSVAALSDRHIIFRQRVWENLAPKSRTDEIPLKELVRDETLTILLKRHGVFAQEIGQEVQQALRALAEIDQVVEFNLEAALSLFEKEDEGNPAAAARNLALEGLQRTRNQIGALIAQNQSLVASCRSGLTKNSREFVDSIQELLDSEKILAVKLRVARAQAREQIRVHVRKIWQVTKRALPIISTLGLSLLQRARQQYARIRKAAGLAPAGGVLAEGITHLLTETQSIIAGLPYLYQRLFRIEPLVEERFFSGRQAEWEAIAKDFSAWQKGHIALTALVGERGSGRTSFLNHMERKFAHDFSFTTIDIDQTTCDEIGLLAYLQQVFDQAGAHGLDDLENFILAKSEKRVCIVENIQNLYLRAVDGFAALERFLLFVSRTHGKVFWIVTCTLYSWRYLDKVLNLAKYFHRVITLQALTPEEVEAIILKRHRVSGYRLHFETPASVSQSRKFKKLGAPEERQAYLKNLMFEQLNEFAIGNITIAILFWLRAIKKVTKEELTLSPLIEFDYSFLNQLSGEELFTLGALLHHETITVAQHAHVFRQEIQASDMLLNRMLNKGILVATANGYLIHPLLYRPIVRVLTSKNILH